MNPNDATVLSQLAVYEAKVGRANEARRHMDAAIAQNSTSPEVLFRRGVALTLIGDRASAVAALRDAVNHGYSAAELRAEDDLSGLANVPEFRALAQSQR